MSRIEQQVTWTGRASDAARAILSAWSIPAKVEDTLKDYKDSKNGLSQRATDLGIAWYQEENGKIWWTMVTGARGDGELTG